jgi:hypothetical protein
VAQYNKKNSLGINTTRAAQTTTVLASV